MHIQELQGKNICILGFGKEGQSTLSALQKYVPQTEITIADQSEEIPARYQIPGVRYQVGPGYLQNLNQFDVVIKSPGIPPTIVTNYSLKPKTYNLTSATQIFLDTATLQGAIIIGVTGSKGKSTTASIIHAILVESGTDTDLVGNIGKPVLDFVETIKENKIFVQEMSSYQLADISSSPHIAVITSFFPEHLDYHGSLEGYIEAKKHITRFQEDNDTVLFPASSDGAREIAAEGKGRKIQVTPEEAPLPLDETHLIGAHNLSNIALAWKTAELLSIDQEIAIRAIRAFHPLPHRLQNLGLHHGIEWVDDAISTTPESTIAAIDALGDRVATILLGGQDRGLDFTKLAERITHSCIKTVILFPGSGPRIRAAIEHLDTTIQIHNVSTMEEAVTIAKNEATNYPLPTTDSPIVLLSPASPSYNMFKNFEEKGESFSRNVHK